MEHRSVIPKIKLLSNKSDVSQDLSNSVIAFQVQKNMNQLAGSFQLVMVPRQSLESENSQSDSKMLAYIYRNIHPMDLISIGVESDGGIMLGIVDNVFRSRTTYNNQVSSQIIVRGRDFGKILIEDNIMTAPASDEGYRLKLEEMLLETNIVSGMAGEDVTQHPLVNYHTNNRAPQHITAKGDSAGRSFIGTTVSEAVKYILKHLTSLRLKMVFDGRKDVSAHELLTYFVDSREGDEIANESFNRYEGSVGNFLYSVVDRELYEIFVETYLEQPALIVRPKPFDRLGDIVTDIGGQKKILNKSDKFIWDQTKNILNGEYFHEVTEQEIIQLNMGVSDYESFSVYIHHPRYNILGAAYDNVRMFFPMHDFFSIKRYGLKVKETVTNLINLEKDEDTFIKDKPKKDHAIQGHRDRAFNWYRYNPILESGTVTVRGHDYYKLGDKIKLVDEIAQNGQREILGYLTGYSHQWQYGGLFTTTLQLTRGENAKAIADFANLTNDMVIRTGI